MFQLTFLLVQFICSVATHLAVVFNLGTIIERIMVPKIIHSLINFDEGIS
jgi:hypothetical protein